MFRAVNVDDAVALIIALTCSKVYGGVQSLQRPTGHFPVCVPICCEQDRLFTKKPAEQCPQVTHVVVVAGKITSIFIFHLLVQTVNSTLKSLNDNGFLYLDGDDVAPIDIEPRFHSGQQDSEPVADRLDITWCKQANSRSI